MSAGSAPSWPDSRVLLGWWRELLGRRPRQLWFGHLLVHGIDAPFRTTRTRPLDRWQHALLHLLATRLPCESPENALADLHMDRQVLARLVREWLDAGLLRREADRWHWTDAGRNVLESGVAIVRSEARRTLYFTDNTASDRPSHFLPLRRPPRSGCESGEVTPRFDLASLEVCLRQSPEWKARHRFPMDMEAVLPLTADWRRVILDSLTSLALVVVRTVESNVLGFAVRTESWTLEPEPILMFAPGEAEELPDLVAEPPPEMWRRAWQTWCHPRGLSSADVEACQLERVEQRLRVHAPPQLLEQLRAAHSEAIEQKAWLLAGAGRIRCAAQIDLQACEAERAT